MAMIGAILGDIAGSQYEFERCRPIAGIDPWNCVFFSDRCVFTDDTVLTVAVKKAIMEQRNFLDVYREMVKKYLYVGYGTNFLKWIRAKNESPTDSCGNGTAMRISYIAECYDDLDSAIKTAIRSAVCTHKHPEAVKGAVVAMTCMWMAVHHESKKEIERYAVKQYPSRDYEFGCDIKLESYRDSYRFDATCQGSVPVAIRCFLESTSYENCLRNAFSLHCDLDTVCCIAGGIAESYYHGTDLDEKKLLRYYLDDALYEWVMK